MIQFLFKNQITGEMEEVFADDWETAEIQLETKVMDFQNWVGLRDPSEDPIGLFDTLND